MPQFVFELDVDFTIEQLAARTCRDVLLSDLDNDVYSNSLSGLSTAEFVDDMLTRAYEKVIRLIYHIRSLRTARNSFAPISRLPNELLSCIFRICAPEDESVAIHLAFSQVCTSWRRIALANPSLWTEVDVSRPDLARLFLQRSQPMPVSFSFLLHNRLDDYVRYRDRLQSLFLSRRSVDPEVTDYLSGQFSKLEVLTIRIHEYGLEVSDIDAPRLRYLSLHNFPLRDLGATVSGHLTHLSLRFARPQAFANHAEFMFTIPYILAVLKSCPGLTLLALRGALNAAGMHRHGQEDQQEVQLFHLQDLYLAEDVFTYLCLLPNLYTPACACIHLQSTSDHNAVCEELPAIMHRFVQHAGWESAHTVSLTLYHAGLDVSVKAAYAPVAHSTNIDRDLTLSLSLHDWVSPDDFLRMRNFCQAFSEHLLQGELRLSVYIVQDETPLAGSSHFWATIAALPALWELMIGPSVKAGWVRLDLEHTVCAPLLLALRVPGVPIDDPPRHHKPFPALRKLILGGFDLSYIAHGQTMRAHLLAFQEQRQREGCPVDIQPPVAELTP